jgi:peptidoglycan/xylan/chitin deacetylase (PgdA/CDA1 family)
MEMKALAAMMANYSGFLNGYAFFRRKFTKSQVAIFMYHRVSPRNDNWSYRPLSPQSFEEQIHYFCRNFEIISLVELTEYIRQGKSLPEKAVVITFDDGYKDNYLYAYPIIKKYHIPAMLFLTTGHIGKGNLFWWDKVSYIIQHAHINHINIDKLGSHPMQSEADKFQANYLIIERLKKIPEEEKNFLIEKLFNISGVVNIPSDVGQRLILSWDEVCEMNSDGIAFGAHSVSHPILINMPLEQAKWEIMQSKKDIEEKLGEEIGAFSYPNGDSNIEISEFVQESGFTCAVSVLPSKLVSLKDNPYELSRIEPIEDSNKFKAMFCGFGEDLLSIVRLFRR